MIALIEGCGTNLNSIQYALERLGYQYVLTQDAAVIQDSTAVILPGVGHAEYALEQLHRCQLIELIPKLRQPVLGICLGMQLLFTRTEEGNVAGFNIIPGEVKQFSQSHDSPVPHMGWNQLMPVADNHPLLAVPTPCYCYFVHSYYAPCNEFTLATAHYQHSFAAIVHKDNFYGMQFHPERSGHHGELLLGYFLRRVYENHTSH